MAKRLIKSADEAKDQNDENQFEIDESVVDEVSNAEEFADVEITEQDIMDAVEAIDVLADAVLEKADAEEKKLDADELLDQVRNMIDESHEEEPEEEEFEESEVPEEIESSVVRVMVSEDGAIDLEQKPDEIYDSQVDGLECTVFDTVDDYPMDDMEETADAEKVDDDVLVIGNSNSTKYRKGYVTIKSGRNKRAWSAAYKKVKKMVGSSKLTKAHWVIVAALAKKEEEEDDKKKKIECKLIRMIRSRKELKSRFEKAFIKSNTEPDVQPEGQTKTEAKPDKMAEPDNNGYKEEPNDGIPKEAGDPDGVDENFSNPTEDPDKQVEHENDDIVLPEESIVTVEVPLTNSTRKIHLRKVRSSKARNYNLYKVVESGKLIDGLDGRVVTSGKMAFAFKNTTQGVIACCAKYVKNGKGTYKPVLKNNKVVISRGQAAPVFQSYENIQIAKAILSARREGIKSGLKRGIGMSRRHEVASSRRNKETVRKPVTSGRNMDVKHRQAVKSNIEVRRAQMREQKALESKAQLMKMHEAEERQRLFQSSQTQMNEEKVALKSASNRNTATLSKLYDSMF